MEGSNLKALMALLLAGVLMGALGAVFGVFALSRLPMHWHPLFTSKEFERASNDGFFAIGRALWEARKLMDLSSVYTLLDAEGTYYIGSKDGTITAYGDARPGDPTSPIEKKREVRLDGASGLQSVLVKELESMSGDLTRFRQTAQSD